MRIPSAAAFILAVSTVAATAQSPICQRLEAQLASLDRGSMDPARAEQMRRYDDTLNRQQYEYDRLNAQARQLDCTSSGFFSLFQSPSPQCNALNRQIEQSRNNIARLRTEMQQMSGNLDRAGQRRALLTALGENDCGPQYRSAAAPRTLFDTLFGPSRRSGGGEAIYSDEGAGMPSGTYRTVCVRTCDGYYYPISFATNPGRFQEDERICQRTCPAAQVSLYTYRNPGEEIAQAVSLGGQNYSSLPTAFRYRQQYDAACSCRQPGQSWADAMKESGATEFDRGDSVVTQDRARQMSLPRDAKGRPIKDPAVPPSAKAAASSPANAADDGLRGSTAPKRTIRTVGPQFLPVQ
ncbi:DUF2865 domain-containing protein [Pseudorhodoplanes sp.]|uniref:DUF2865 domain-containing protein n=1 Tax=Pseudorhodoplanes sp. TaxID=1934341 RepID=UPI002CCED99C|nr:DUF2865 domain-containing protein [Pseudorhodoplanes sp.]HWV51789.1 DUF2865 domain-containing protein [Pseudorhodoplanes sp.]